MALKASYGEGEEVPGPGTWRDLVRLIKSRAIKAIPPLYRTVRRWGTDLWLGLPARFDGIITAAGGGAYTVAEARFNKTTGLWSALAGGRVVANAYEYNLSATAPVGSAVEVRLSIVGDWRFYRPSTGATSGNNCVTPPSLTLSVALSCCCPTSDDVAVTWSFGGSSIGSCHATPSITETFSVAHCYTQTNTPSLCAITSSLPLGSVVTWTAIGALIGTYSGSMTVKCEGDGAAILWEWVDTLPSTLHLIDPDGNSIVMTEGPSRTWTGTQAYTRTDTKGGLHSFTMSYQWSNCRLLVGFLDLGTCGSDNRCIFGGSFFGFPYGVHGTKSCFPLSMAYGVPLVPGGTCAADLFDQVFVITGGTWRKFTAACSWTMML